MTYEKEIMKRKLRIVELQGGPMNGHETERQCAYLDNEGNPLSTPKGDRMRRTGKGGLYYFRGGFYEWQAPKIKETK
jgi:hypothetical protein